MAKQTLNFHGTVIVVDTRDNTQSVNIGRTEGVDRYAEVYYYSPRFFYPQSQYMRWPTLYRNLETLRTRLRERAYRQCQKVPR